MKAPPPRFSIGNSPLGSVLVATSDKGICAVTMADNSDILLSDIERRFPGAEQVRKDADVEEAVAQIIGLMKQPQKALKLPLDIRGTAFQQKVWQALQKIPPGKTASYLDIAKAIGKPKAVRAVAQACGANNIAIVIPCHRVVRSDGALSGYRWGVERKAALLQQEQL